MLSANSTVVSNAVKSGWSYNMTVKEEPEWSECGVSDASAAEGLHDFKYEIEIEPELIQEQDAAISVKRELDTTEEDLFPPACTDTVPWDGPPHCDISHTQQYPADAPKIKRRKIYYSLNLPKTPLRKPDPCSVCKKQFLQQEELDHHMKTHITRKSFSCDLCEKKFTQNATLNEHKKIHTIEKTFSCVFCNMQFTKKRLLDQHTRTHTDDTCGVCGKQFSNRQNLTRHMRAHSNDILYSCDICKKRYRKDIHLKRKRIPSGKPNACPGCEEQFAYAFNLAQNDKNKGLGANTSAIKLEAAQQKKHLHIWQLSKETTTESLSAHVITLLGSEAEVEIKRVKPKLEKDYTSFIITVRKEQYERLLKPEVWPQNAEFAEWVWFPRPAVKTKNSTHRTPQPEVPRLPWR